MQASKELEERTRRGEIAARAEKEGVREAPHPGCFCAKSGEVNETMGDEKNKSEGKARQECGSD
jgi:hypothetical protein